MGVKPFGAFTVALLVVAVVVLTLWQGRVNAIMPALGNAAVIGAVAFAACVPWMLHTYRLTGDPVFPAFYRLRYHRMGGTPGSAFVNGPG